MGSQSALAGEVKNKNFFLFRLKRMNPREFKYLALRLAHHGSTTAEFRSSINRAYYAAYNVGVEFLRDIGTKVRNSPEGHSDVINGLSYSKDKELEIIGSQLDDLRSDRIKADYRMDNSEIETQGKAKIAISQAIKMIDSMDACKNDLGRKKTVAESIQDCIERINSASKKSPPATNPSEITYK